MVILLSDFDESEMTKRINEACDRKGIAKLTKRVRFADETLTTVTESREEKVKRLEKITEKWAQRRKSAI